MITRQRLSRLQAGLATTDYQRPEGMGLMITPSVAVDPGPGPLTRSFAHGACFETAAGSPDIGKHPTRLPASARHGAFSHHGPSPHVYQSTSLP